MPSMVMYSLPDRPRRSIERTPECQLRINEIIFVKGPPKQIEIEIENEGDIVCSLMNSVQMKTQTSVEWTPITVTWNPVLVAPNGSSKTNVVSEWTSGETYILKVQSEKGDIWATQKAP